MLKMDSGGVGSAFHKYKPNKTRSDIEELAFQSEPESCVSSNVNGVNSICTNLSSSSKAVFIEKIKNANHSCQTGDYQSAVRLYTEAISLDPSNHVLFGNRSAAYCRMGKYARALKDAIKAREVNPKWSKSYYRQGVALQYLNQHADALAAFASGLAQDNKSPQLLTGFIETAMKSPLRATLEPVYRQLQAMNLDKSPFVITSVIGQELLGSGHYAAAVVVLESSLRIGTCSLKLRGSVYSALSFAYWALNDLDKAIQYMQQDLQVAKSLGDQLGECRAHGNLGAAYFSKGNYRDALASHRYQLNLAMKGKFDFQCSSSLTALGHVYIAIGDFSNALASHRQCLQLVRQMNDKLGEAREIGNVGAVYLSMGSFDKAIEHHLDHLKLAKQMGNKTEEAKAYSNLGSAYHAKRNYEQAIQFHEHLLQLAQEIGDRSIEARAYAGLGHAVRCLGDLHQAKRWHERQLDIALLTKDKTGEGRACSNLGIVYHLLGDFDGALKLHWAHLQIAKQSNDAAGMGRAYGNIGNCYGSVKKYEEAIKYHKQELTISREVGDRASEACTHGNLAIAYQALGLFDMALAHCHHHLNLSIDLKDKNGEACALSNLGNCYSSRKEFKRAIPYYEKYLKIVEEIDDREGQIKANHCLGYSYYSADDHEKAIQYYQRDLELAKDLQDHHNLGKAYCNLSLAHSALNQHDQALECAKYFLAISGLTKQPECKYRALNNIGVLFMKMNKFSDAIKIFEKQLHFSKSQTDAWMEANCYASLGHSYKLMQKYEDALNFYKMELALRQKVGDAVGSSRAFSHLGDLYLLLGNNHLAIKAFVDELDDALVNEDGFDERLHFDDRMNIRSQESEDLNLNPFTTLFEKRDKNKSSNPTKFICDNSNESINHFQSNQDSDEQNGFDSSLELDDDRVSTIKRNGKYKPKPVIPKINGKETLSKVGLSANNRYFSDLPGHDSRDSFVRKGIAYAKEITVKEILTPPPQLLNYDKVNDFTS